MEQPRVLLVEDDPLLRELLEMLLSLEGLEVVQAENGLVALEKLQRGGVGLVVLDLMMPLMDGLRFLEEFSRLPPDRPPVLVLSANSDAETAERARIAGAAAIARKPVDQENFIATVRGLVDGGAKRR